MCAHVLDLCIQIDYVVGLILIRCVFIFFVFALELILCALMFLICAFKLTTCTLLLFYSKWLHVYSYSLYLHSNWSYVHSYCLYGTHVFVCMYRKTLQTPCSHEPANTVATSFSLFVCNSCFCLYVQKDVANTVFSRTCEHRRNVFLIVCM